jgi:putative ABC transport system ATP-binding protein
MALLELQNIARVYGFGEATTVAVDDVNLTIEEGEFVAVMGPSGSGKSTLMNILGLLDTPTHGSYILDGKPVTGLSGNKRAEIRRNKIGFIFQSFNLLNRMTVIDNVALPLMYSGLGHVERLERASEILKKLGLSEREYYYPNQLSGGQAQRVAIARALANDPSIILADEPTGNLDTKTSERIMGVLSDIHKEGNTIVMVTHEEHMATFADRIIHVIDGKVTEQAKTKKKSKKTTQKTAKKPAKSGKKSAKKTTKKASKKTTKKSAKKGKT